MKIGEKIQEQIYSAGGLIVEENTERFIASVISVVRDEENPRDSLYFALRRYLKVNPSMDDEEIERIFAGVLAFIWVNLWGDPYQPVYMYPTEEEPKKWWQFWK